MQSIQCSHSFLGNSFILEKVKTEINFGFMSNMSSTTSNKPSQPNKHKWRQSEHCLKSELKNPFVNKKHRLWCDQNSDASCCLHELVWGGSLCSALPSNNSLSMHVSFTPQEACDWSIFLYLTAGHEQKWVSGCSEWWVQDWNLWLCVNSQWDSFHQNGVKADSQPKNSNLRNYVPQINEQGALNIFYWNCRQCGW